MAREISENQILKIAHNLSSEEFYDFYHHEIEGFPEYDAVVETRNICTDDLQLMKEVSGLDDFGEFCFDLSMIGFNKNGDIKAFVLVRRSSIADYYGGEIPTDKLASKNPHYYDGAEVSLRNDINEHFADSQYEVTYAYLANPEEDRNLSEVYHKIPAYGVFWTTSSGMDAIAYHFYNFNNEMLIDMPYID